VKNSFDVLEFVRASVLCCY